MPRSKLAGINIRNIDELQPTAETNAPPVVDTCIEDDGIQPSSAANVNTVGRDGQHRVRGRTTLRELWTLPPQDRILVSGNNIGQPIDEETRLLSGFLGMFARNGMKLPLHYETWHKVPQRTKDEALSFIEERFILQNISRKYLCDSLGKKWRDYKCSLKKKYFDRNTDPNVIMQNVPPGVVRWQYEALVAFWYSKEGEEREKRGISSRKHQKYTHTGGSKSFARIRNEQEKIRGAKIGRVELFRITHTKKDGSYLNETSQRIVEATKEKMVELEALADTAVSQQDLEDRAFIEVVGKERNGRVRGLGMGPTPSSYYGHQARQFSQSNTQQEVFTLRERLQTMEARVKELESERETQQAKFQQMQEQFYHMMNLMQQQVPETSSNQPPQSRADSL